MNSVKNTAPLARVLAQASRKGAGTVIMFLACVVAGAWWLGSVAPNVLQFLFDLIIRVMAPRAETPDPFPAINIFGRVPFALLGGLLGGFAAVRLSKALEAAANRWDRMDVGDKVNTFLGVIGGCVCSIPLFLILQVLDIQNTYRALIVVAIITGFSALFIYMLQSMAEVLPWSKLRGPGKRTGTKLLDTNVIIDGRIYDVIKSGFLEGNLYVPGFVLDELQYIADNHDALKRQRGRRGLDILNHIKAEFQVEFRVHDRLAVEAQDGVDGRLVRLAKALGADIVTNDFNLNRVAVLQGIKVLNLNDLALSLRPNVLPSEELEITLVREGKEFGQGVGYLEDGTMVVVENGKHHLGETLSVTVKQVIQTERGKMIFADLEPAPESRDHRRRYNPRRSTS